MRKHIRFILTLISLFIFLILTIEPAANAMLVDGAASLPGPTIQIRLDPQVKQRYVPPPDAFLQRLSSSEQAATANITVNYVGGGWTAEAKTAFEYAVDIWEALITSPEPIVVDAEFSPLAPGVLGGASPTRIWRDFPNAPQANTWYPVATANKLANTDLSPTYSDIEATFSSSYLNWHFGTGSSTPSNKISFVSVVLHELGHGLGFVGSMRYNDSPGSDNCSGPVGRGCYGYSGYPMIYDRFTENGSGTALLSYPNNSTSLGNQLTSNSLYFDSPGGNLANGGGRVPLYAPSTWSQGSSYSHLAESFNPTAHALMTYSIAKGETIHHPGSVTLCMFAEMGWTVGESCEVTAISGLAATNDGPTVLGNLTQLTASISAGSHVTYEWDFGDGKSGSGKVVSHQYASPGVYTAEVTATNPVNSVQATTTVIVDQSINGLAASNDGPTALGDPTQLTASVSSGSNVTYHWDFGDGNNGSEAVVSHQYPSPGVYTAEITAINSISQETATTLVQVDETVILISGLTAANDGPTLHGLATQLSANVSSGNSVTYEWDFGDGENATGAEVSHQYASPGTYTAKVTATNSLNQETATTEVQVLEITGRVFMPMLVKP
jgi:PKD repeat protein